MINKIINDIYESLENNNYATLGYSEIPMWQPPLIGIAAGDDEYFSRLKEHIGDFHWTPDEVFALKYGRVSAANLRVVSIVFPQSVEAQNDQRGASIFPCDKWLVSRGEWEPLMKDFSSRLVGALEDKGMRTVSIDLQDEFHLEKSENCGIASTWSHRHAAYAAGLGTFGLTDALITEKGTAVRITSLVVEADFEVTERSYHGIYDWCLHYQNENCGLCVDRCPTAALSETGHDKEKCNDYEIYAESNLWPSHINKGDYIFGCGICQAKIPCQDRRP